MRQLKFPKRVFIFAISVLIITATTSCQPAGTSSQRLTGEEQNLPEELKGLKIYRVATSDGGDVSVAILNGQVNSTTYQVGKQIKSTIIINKQDNKAIEVKWVLMENDSIIVCRK